ncbi:hypothetical protein BJ875DRAFT_28326 [Amylocarpus encephaloides]|uniref:25S rRNA (uridine-N(3))-methyltransferase BMT5-like domain-containing protein n=1 Tax=Amylocarpus encephaloides TaxID=45428 RepID=A0A9P7YJ45_9HELO|nr:hypothetical protein BJ875DRAFT_28326 [Amylocarpus encephaloides]
MGKNRRLSSQTPKRQKHPHTSGRGARPTGVSKSKAIARKPHSQPSQSKPAIPFLPSDRILLVGEGDLSYAHSLINRHRCKNVTATVLESSEDELISKYPSTPERRGVDENIKALKADGGALKSGVDVSRKNYMGKSRDRWERVVFNFPHVGGKSTDINRQVRSNQQLLVSFFTNTVPLLSPDPGSSILITLFEGEPYTLWNIRDLARHSGLEVKRSFRFQADAYPGYKHARTLGVVKRKDGSVGNGWKGEHRAARTYEFVRKGEGERVGSGKQGDESSDDEDVERLVIGDYHADEHDEDTYDDEEYEPHLLS